MIVGYILGYTLVAFIVAKISFVVMLNIRKGNLYRISTLKEQCLAFGITWIISVPFGLFFLIMAIIIFVLIEGGKKLL